MAQHFLQQSHTGLMNSRICYHVFIQCHSDQKAHFIVKECENRITPLAAGDSPIIAPALPKRLLARSLHEVLFSGRILSGWSPVIKYVIYIMSNPPVRVCDDKGQNRSTNVSCCCRVYPPFISVAVNRTPKSVINNKLGFHFIVLKAGEFTVMMVSDCLAYLTGGE